MAEQAIVDAPETYSASAAADLDALRVISTPQLLPRDTRVAFVTESAPHYRIRMFEALAGMCRLRCYFYSDSGEWDRPRQASPHGGDFPHQYLAELQAGRISIVRHLAAALLFDDYDVVVKCMNDPFAVALTYLAARLRRVPFVLWTGVWQHRAFPLTLWLYRHSDAIVATGEHLRRYLISHGVEPDRIFLAPPAIDNTHYREPVSDSSREALRRWFGFPANARILLYAGRLERGRGLQSLLDAFAFSTHKDRALVLCGAGALEPELRRRTRILRAADRVFFAGPISPAGMVRFYNVAWAVVLPAITTAAGGRPWGVAVNEAFNQGVPVIASDAVGAVAGGLVQHLRNGLVVPEHDAGALGGAMDHILADSAIRNRMGENARADIAAWTQTRMAEGFRDAVWFALRLKQSTSKASC